MTAYISVSQKRWLHRHAAIHTNNFLFFSSVNLSPELNRNQRSGKFGKLISSVLQKTKHFSHASNFTQQREENSILEEDNFAESSVQC